MEKALEDAEGKILAFCRSGTRSTLLWALTRARAGDNCDKLSATAAKAGYDLSSIRPMMDRSEEHTSELQSLMRISYAVFCLKKKTLIPSTRSPSIIKISSHSQDISSFSTLHH